MIDEALQQQLREQYNPEGSVRWEVQQRLLETLVAFDEVCRAEGLTYFLDYGTLLGAFRHGGFIPWDDDVDVSMPSADFKKFQQVAPEKLDDRFFLQTKKSDKAARMGHGLMKVRRNGTLSINRASDFHVTFHRGISIDIFESVPTPAVRRPFFRWMNRRIGKSFGFFAYPKPISLGNIVRFFWFPVEYVLMKGIWKLACTMRPKDREAGTMERNDTKYPTLTTDLYPTGELTFEGHTFSVPHNVEARLTSIYGKNYMTLPPEDKRKMHAVFMCPDTSREYTIL
ncbi:MAG: LicD family protein [Bacteroidaceae bacterium]|nr:LicD family protein [Bacteroidaceae bacterium]